MTLILEKRRGHMLRRMTNSLHSSPQFRKDGTEDGITGRGLDPRLSLISLETKRHHCEDLVPEST
jgi:hypothetical protein